MEITSNKVNPLALEGLVPTKASFVELEAKQALEKVAPLEIPPTDQSEEPRNTESLQVAVAKINDYMQNVERSLQFTIDEDSGRDIVTVLDKKTEEIIRQFPSDEVLVIARQIAENNNKAISLVDVVA